MSHNRFIFILLTFFLAHTSADAMLTRKRSREDDSLVTSMQPKKQKVICPKNPFPIELKRHKGMFYCEWDIYKCSFVTGRMDKIKEHHRLHGVSYAFSCKDCDYLGATSHCVSNHASKWHPASNATCKNDAAEPLVKKSMRMLVSSSSSEDLVLPINEKKECGYCGREGENMKRHMEVYHTPRFGKRSYFQCFPLYRPGALSVPSQSSSGTESE